MAQCPTKGSCCTRDRLLDDLVTEALTNCVGCSPSSKPEKGRPSGGHGVDVIVGPAVDRRAASGTDAARRQTAADQPSRCRLYEMAIAAGRPDYLRTRAAPTV